MRTGKILRRLHTFNSEFLASYLKKINYLPITKPNAEYTLKTCNCKCYVVVPYIFVYFKGRSTLQMSEKMVLRTTFRRKAEEEM
jgi:hypothetical protein